MHTLGLVLWFLALPHIPLADTTALGFTTPLFIMVGAWLFLREPMRWERGLATAVGFAGVLIVVGPRLGLGPVGSGGGHHLLILGWLMFADLPTPATLLGGVVILAATLWVKRREQQRAVLAGEPGP